MVWSADLIAIPGRGRRCHIYSLDPGKPETCPNGWQYIGSVAQQNLVRNIAEKMYLREDLRVDGLVPISIKSKSIDYRQEEADLLQICWCRSGEFEGIQPFLLTLPARSLGLISEHYGSLLAPEFVTFAQKVSEEFLPYGPATFEIRGSLSSEYPDQPHGFRKWRRQLNLPLKKGSAKTKNSQGS